jgi:rod shape-determining protein MreB
MDQEDWTVLFALDIGTANIRVAQFGKGVVLLQPSLVADCHSLPLAVAFGHDVQPMLGRAPSSLHIYHPFQNGHLAAPGATTLLLHSLLKSLGLRLWPRPTLRLVVPGQATAVERTQLVQAVREAGFRKVSLVAAPIACAHASGIEVSRLKSVALVDIGASITEMAVVSEQIVHRRSLRLGGTDFDEALRDALSDQAGMEVSLQTARQLKETIGSAAGGVAQVTGKERASGLPRTRSVDVSLLTDCFEPALQRLEELLRGVLDQLSPLICKDIQSDGLALAGGGALLAGLPEHLEKRLGVRVRLVPEPLSCAVLGALCVAADLCEEPIP